MAEGFRRLYAQREAYVFAVLRGLQGGLHFILGVMMSSHLPGGRILSIEERFLSERDGGQTFPQLLDHDSRRCNYSEDTVVLYIHYSIIYTATCKVTRVIEWLP